MTELRLKSCVVVLAMLSAVCGTVLAQERMLVGARNLGMGGTGVPSGAAAAFTIGWMPKREKA